MGHLVRNLRGLGISAQLECAYKRLVSEWHRGRGKLVDPLDGARHWRELAARIADADAPLPLGHVETEFDLPDEKLIDAGPWSRVEIYNSFRHIEVLLASMELLPTIDRNATFVHCAPTQGSSDSNKDSAERNPPRDGRLTSADLEGTIGGRDFVLEAYGGVNYRNNSKMAQDFAALMQRRATKGIESRCFIVVRHAAIASDAEGRQHEPSKNWKRGKQISATCEPRHGGYYRMSALITDVWPPPSERASYRLIELDGDSFVQTTDR